MLGQRRGIFAFYAQLAISSGWMQTGANYLGEPNAWHKTYPTGLHAVLQLLDLYQRQVTAGAVHRYVLNCGVSSS